jgi:hypothetical protein
MIGRLIPGDKLEKLDGENLEPHSWAYLLSSQILKFPMCLSPILANGRSTNCNDIL